MEGQYLPPNPKLHLLLHKVPSDLPTGGRAGVETAVGSILTFSPVKGRLQLARQVGS